MIACIATLLATYSLTIIAMIMGYWLGATRPLEQKKQKGLGAILHSIRDRKVANDVWSTPVEIVKAQVGHVESVVGRGDYKWVDPFRHTGRYYNNYPVDVEKDWCEITQGRDAFEYDYKDAVVVSNPPYSILSKLLEKMSGDKAKVISFLILSHAVTAPRIEKMENAGYQLQGLTYINIKGWMNPVIATWIRRDGREHLADLDYIYIKGGHYEDNTGEGE